MHQRYQDVNVRFLYPNEKLIQSDDQAMPLVIEAQTSNDLPFLCNFLTTHATSILSDISHYGAVLLRGFQVASDADFERAVLSIQGMQGISDAFMSEAGRTQVDGLKYVLHTNSIYKTGGTLYLGGFHSENYYSPDVPAYICFHCRKPSDRGGETGLIHMGKIYDKLPEALKEKLEKQTFFVSKWLISDVVNRYQIPVEQVKKIAKAYHLPILGEGKNQFIAFYKPSVYLHPQTHQRSLQINLFELPTLNKALRQAFMADYAGKDWFWHRLLWRLPSSIIKAMEIIYLNCALFFHYPKKSYEAARSKLLTFIASQTLQTDSTTRVGDCFTQEDITLLAGLLRQYYVSCLWQPGDILLVDNTQIAHAGMPGAGERKIRAMICNPLQLPYQLMQPGTILSQQSNRESIGACAAKAADTI